MTLVFPRCSVEEKTILLRFYGLIKIFWYRSFLILISLHIRISCWSFCVMSCDIASFRFIDKVIHPSSWCISIGRGTRFTRIHFFSFSSAISCFTLSSMMIICHLCRLCSLSYLNPWSCFSPFSPFSYNTWLIDHIFQTNIVRIRPSWVACSKNRKSRSKNEKSFLNIHTNELKNIIHILNHK